MPTVQQILDHYLNVRVINTNQSWEVNPSLESSPLHHSNEIAIHLAYKGVENYVDCHCFVYTYMSFIKIFEAIKSMGFLRDLEILEVFPPEKYSNEFIVSLRKKGTINISHLDIEEIFSKYENKIIHKPFCGSGKDDGWYLVKNGKKKWITDGRWLERNGYNSKMVTEVDPEIFSIIPEDKSYLS